MIKNDQDLTKRDLNAIWHPCSQMKDYETFLPLCVERAEGPYLILQDGTKVLDAISSWWCKSLGHAHPRLKKALIEQAEKFEHVLLANTTHEVIVELSEQLTQLTKTLKKIFYATEGSSSVEIALKMCIHARQIRGQIHKKKILALSNSYHGETLFALAVSDLGLYRQPYEEYLPKIEFIQCLPYVSSRKDVVWEDCLDYWIKIEKQLNDNKENLSAIILEPIVQGAAGMLIYSKDFLQRLRNWCSKHDVYLIADEIMTGLGRTGRMFACEHAAIEPDFLCLGKGLTAGYLPMSAVLTTDSIYQLFYEDYETGKSFLHSHTYSGNALAAAVALETLRIIEAEKILDHVNNLETNLFNFMMEVAEKTKKIENVRYLGGIVAADLKINHFAETKRAGYEVYKKAVALGALLRPLGDTIYWLPPLNIKMADLQRLQDITIEAIMSA